METRDPRYMPRLDGLRALAIGLVLLQHFAPTAGLAALGTGSMGVKLFFVLSGFLITGILLDLRAKSEPRGHAAAQFYWRRFLRLTPALWLAIGAAAALGIGMMRQDWWVHALYLSNFLVVARDGYGPVGHFWSLAVEEQFYLLWFAVVMLLPTRALLPISISFLIIAPLYRGGLQLAGFSNFPGVLLPGNIDSLAAGALLAIARRSLPRAWALAQSPALLVLGIAGVAILGRLPATDLARRLVYPGFITLASAVLVAMAANGQGRITALAGWPPLRHIGQISYGIYVYHYFLPQIAAAYLPHVAQLAPWPRAGIYLAASLAIAQASWWGLEKPMRRFRNAIPTLPRRRVGLTPSPEV